MIVDGVVSGVDLVNGGWTVGNEHIKTYQTSQSLISPASVGDEVLFFCVRSLTPGPLTIESTYNILAGPLIQPYKPTAVEVHPMYNGKIVSMGPSTWTIAGPAGAPVTFIVDDPEGKARIDPLPFPAFSVGMPVTVEFEHVGGLLPDDANWAPMSQTPGTTTWTAGMGLPSVSANQTGTLFLRTTDATQQSSTTAATVTLAVAGPLAAATNAASNIAASVAVLHGNLASIGTATSASVNFEWGTVSGSLTNATPVQTVAAPGGFAATISGLSPSTVYYFRSKVTANPGGTVFGAQMSLTTGIAPPPPPPPVFSGGGGGPPPTTTVTPDRTNREPHPQLLGSGADDRRN